MFPLIALGLVAYLLMQQKGTEERASSQVKGWSILLAGPAALPQAAIPELLKQFGIQQMKMARIDNPKAGYNVLTVTTPDVVLAQVGKVVTAMGVPLTVVAITPAPIS